MPRMEKLLFFTLLSANYIFFKKHNKQMSKKDHFLKELSWKTVKKQHARWSFSFMNNYEVHNS